MPGVVDDEGGLEVVVGLGELSVEEVQGGQKVGQRQRHFFVVKLCFQQFYSHVAQLLVGGAVHGEEFEEFFLILRLAEGVLEKLVCSDYVWRIHRIGWFVRDGYSKRCRSIGIQLRGYGYENSSYNLRNRV